MKTDEKRNTTISHLLCSRGVSDAHPHPKHAPKPHLGYGSISFFCVLAPEGMNVIVFEREGRGRNQKATACSKDIPFKREK